MMLHTTSQEGSGPAGQHQQHSRQATLDDPPPPSLPHTLAPADSPTLNVHCTAFRPAPSASGSPSVLRVAGSSYLARLANSGASSAVGSPPPKQALLEPHPAITPLKQQLFASHAASRTPLGPSNAEQQASPFSPDSAGGQMGRGKALSLLQPALGYALVAIYNNPQL